MITEIDGKFRFADNRYVVRDLFGADVSLEYIGWLNNKGNRTNLWIPEDAIITVESQKEYIKEINSNEHRAIWGLFHSDGSLIGSAGLHYVGQPNKHPAVGVLIGDRNYRGIGLGKAWVWFLTHVLISRFSARKVVAGTLTQNKPSLNSFLGVGFQVEGILREDTYRGKHGWCDLAILGCLKDELKEAGDFGIQVDHI